MGAREGGMADEVILLIFTVVLLVMSVVTTR